MKSSDLEWTDTSEKTGYTKQPKVTLVTHTKDPLEAIALGIDIWHMAVGDIDPFSLTEGEMLNKFRWLLKQPHQTPFEYVNFVFLIENVSRAWQQQMTRHRVGFSYSIQSLRVIDVGNFATEGRYHMPESVIDKEEYHKSMKLKQNGYKNAIELGETTEDARGLLPLNIHSPVTFSCSYRSLMGLLKQRLCVAAQEEWRNVVEGIRSEIEIMLHPVFLEPLDCMCKRFTNGKGMCKTLHCLVDRDGKGIEDRGKSLSGEIDPCCNSCCKYYSKQSSHNCSGIIDILECEKYIPF